MPTQNEELHDLRARVLRGEEVTAAEYAQVVDSLRKSRTASEQRTRTRKAKTKVDPTPIDFGKLAAEIVGVPKK